MRKTKEEPTTVPKKGISIPNIIPSIVFAIFILENLEFLGALGYLVSLEPLVSLKPLVSLDSLPLPNAKIANKIIKMHEKAKNVQFYCRF
jgi:hypothetical protein